MSSAASISAENQVSPTFEYEVPSKRARALSAVRATLHGAVVIAFVLSILGVENVVAVACGVIFGAAFGLRSRRIAVRFTKTGVEIHNYFRSFKVDSLQGAVVHLYMRNRTELELEGQKQFFVQSATLLDEADHAAFMEAMQARGATVTGPALKAS